MKFLFNQVSESDFQKKLSNYISTFWGPGYQIKVQLATSTPNAAQSTGQASPMTPDALKKKQTQDDIIKTQQLVESHPLVQNTNEIFKSKIQAIEELP